MTGSSIRLNLLKWLIAPLLLINLVGAGLTFWLAWTPTRTAWDQSLADAAWALVPRLKDNGTNVVIDLTQQAEQVLRVDHFDSIFFVVRDTAGTTLAGDQDFPPMPSIVAIDDPHADEGMMRKEPVRVITLKTRIGAHTVYIGAAETLRKRTRSLWLIVAALLTIEVLLTCVAIAVVRSAVRKALRPLESMRNALDRRRDIDLSPLPEVDAPVELEPLLAAVNGLLQRAQDGASAQRNFLANVAHQLRTPLAGVKIHLEWLQARHADNAETAATASMMMAATERMIRQSNQLLALARAEPSYFNNRDLEPVALDELVSEAVQQFVQQADLRRIDLGFDLRPARVVGDRFLLRDLVDNLIDNAIRYTPVAGTVTVRCWEQDQHCILAVEDSGPGIAAAHREAVFDRFYRIDDKTDGSGLGLAIVRDIVADHGAQVTIACGENGGGTHFVVTFNVEPDRRKAGSPDRNRL